MDSTFGYILVCQSPAMFLAALVLLISFLTRRRNHHVLAVAELIFAIICAVLGVALYYMGMLHNHFTIHDFWQIRTWGWIGVAVVAVLTVYSICRHFRRMAHKRSAEKEANRSANARQQELEKIKAEAYEAGKADAQAAAAAPDLKPVEPEPTPTYGEIHE